MTRETTMLAELPRYKNQVALLEGKLAAKDNALREIVGHLKEVDDGVPPEEVIAKIHAKVKSMHVATGGSGRRSSYLRDFKAQAPPGIASDPSLASIVEAKESEPVARKYSMKGGATAIMAAQKSKSSACVLM